MSYLSQDDKQLQDQQNQNQQNQNNNQGPASQGTQGSAQTGGGSSPLVGASSASVNGSAPQSPQQGGGNGWTNLQSYLTANQGNTGASDLFNKEVGNTFSQDQDAYRKQGSDLTNQANQAVSNNYIAPDQASQWISSLSGMDNSNKAVIRSNQMRGPAPTQLQSQPQPQPQPQSQAVIHGPGQMRGPAPTSTQPAATSPETPPQTSAEPQQNTSSYIPPTDALQRLRTAVNGTYGGPQSFTPSLSAQTQNYGVALGNTDSTNALMNQLYSKNNGGIGLTTGQSNLQGLLQTNDPRFADTRDRLMKQYAGLTTDMSNTGQSVNSALQAAQAQYGQNQADLRKSIQDRATGDRNAIQSAADAWNADVAAERASTPGPNDVYVQGQTATAENAPGVDRERNDFNIIQQILGGQGINAGPVVTNKGGYQYISPTAPPPPAPDQGGGGVPWGAVGVAAGHPELGGLF